MAIKRTAAEAAKMSGSSKSSNGAERESKMDIQIKQEVNPLVHNLWTLENFVSKMRWDGQLLDDVRCSSILYASDRKYLFYFVRDKFKWNSIEDLCYSYINKEISGDDLLRRKLIEGTKFHTKTIRRLISQLKREGNVSGWIFKWLYIYLEGLQEMENHILSFYNYDKDIIFERLQNFGVYYGCSYNGNFIQDLQLDKIAV